MSGKNFKVYRSSAGSGKTFTLAKEYLLIILKNPGYYKNILAVTFTNKATQEMKERVINYLHDLAYQRKPNQMFQILVQESGLSEDEIRENAQIALTNILHNYSLFSITTIDSFFQRILRSFSREMGLVGAYHLELDEHLVLDEVIDQVIDEVGDDKNLTKWLVMFSENKVNEGKHWDIKGNVLQLAKEVFKERFKSFETDILNKADVINQLQNSINDNKKQFEKDLNNYSSHALRVMHDHGLTISNFYHGKSGPMGYFDKIRHDKTTSPNTYVKDALDNPEKWSSRSKPQYLKDKIYHACKDGLQDLLRETVAYYEQNIRDYKTGNELQRYIYVVGILTNITQKLAKYRDENEMMLMSDAAYFLKNLIGTNDAPFIYEKTGIMYQHFLIDEFQDTSGFQWQNFKPLIKNSLATGKMNMVVGDVKQSIYRWRGSDWELLMSHLNQDIGQDFSQHIQLAKNFRSRSYVVDFNNQLFSVAPKILEEEFLEGASTEVLAEFSEMINLAYADVKQEMPSIGDLRKGGYLYFKFYPTKEQLQDKEWTWKERSLAKIPGILQQLQDSGYLMQEVMFLVRTKEEGKDLIDYMMEFQVTAGEDHQYNYDIVSSESLYLKNAKSVQIIIAVIRWLTNPEDWINLFNLIHDYQQFVKNAELTAQQIFGLPKDRGILLKYLPPEFAQLPEFTTLSLYELIEKVIRDFQLHLFEEELAYQHTFLDQVLEFSIKEGGDLSKFLAWWEQTGHAVSIQMSDSIDAAQLLTIHKAKGLQAKVVILPFCNWNLDHNTTFDNIIWAADRSEKFSYLKYYPLKYTKSLGETWFEKDYYEEKTKITIDNLNLLYVALTRAEDQLIAISPMPKISTKGKITVSSVSDLLYRVFSDEHNTLHDYWQSSIATFEFGESIQKQIADPIKKESQERIKSAVSSDWRQRIFIRKKAVDIETEKEQQLTRQHLGRIIHQVLSRVKYEEDLDREIENMYFEGLITEQNQDQIARAIENLMELPQFRDWFSPHWEVKNEIPILTERNLIFRPDRVVYRDSQTAVIDYKTGVPQAEDHQQVYKYLQLLKQMGYTDLKGYLIYLFEPSIESVRKD